VLSASRIAVIFEGKDAADAANYTKRALFGADDSRFGPQTHLLLHPLGEEFARVGGEVGGRSFAPCAARSLDGTELDAEWI
jgi:hypothetical protein